MAHRSRRLEEKGVPMTSSQLQIDVQDELKWDPQVDARHITVTAHDGAVTLSGHLPSYFQKTRAVGATERVHGVKAVADEIEVRLHDTHTREDSDIAESIAYILEWNAALASQHIQAKVSNGLATLTGEVAWNYEREEAGRTINRVLGVKSVVNLITVKPRVVPAQVEKQITNAFARHAALDARQIHVTTSGTKAVLTGHVHSLGEIGSRGTRRGQHRGSPRWTTTSSCNPEMVARGRNYAVGCTNSISPMTRSLDSISIASHRWRYWTIDACAVVEIRSLWRYIVRGQETG
jgi:osmotically-inducible protein OsmY